MNNIATSTGLWRSAFDKDCTHALALSQSLLQARDSVGELLVGIPGDMKGYTVHDLSHLDALWEMADLIAGTEFSLNPAEAYVFGLSVLLHDAGMTVMAYPGGLAELTETPVWKDEAAARNVLGRDTSEIPEQVRSAIVTSALRRLHAERAEQLATQAWQLGGKQYHLIHSEQLRQHYGPIAGKIAHSHHWDPSSLQRRFPNALGALGEMPADWTVEPLKVATLLRCADAAHIDHRRAPRLTFAMAKPDGVSQKHWSFQSKLAKPYRKESRLCYTTTEAFSAEQVDAWYLCYDTARMVDRELLEAEENLKTLGVRFAVDGVCGAKSVTSFAEYVNASGWRPVSVDVQVSDVPSLARTLGGSALYSNYFAPLRELIQNAADSIDARCAVDTGFSRDKGVITVRLMRHDDKWRLDVEDNGIGMSERVLTKALLDFGKSFWRSELMQEEYPEVHGGFVNARGRYGIGFFSVFMWADLVSVASRRFSDAMSDTCVLEFTGGVGKRPVLRQAEPRERSSNIATRVSLVVGDEVASRLLSDKSYAESGRPENPRMHRLRSEESNFLPVEFIVAALDIDVYFESPVGSRLVNNRRWASLSGADFIEYFAKYCGSVEEGKEVGAQVSELVSDGVVIGKGMLVPKYLREKECAILVHERGITIERRHDGSVFGVVEAMAANAARDRAVARSQFDDAAWMSVQKRLIFSAAHDTCRQVSAQKTLVRRGTFSHSHDMFVIDRKICSFANVLDAIAKVGRARFRVKQDYDQTIKWDAVDTLDVLIGLNVKPADVFTLCEIPMGRGDVEVMREIVRGEIDVGIISEIFAEVRRVLGSPASEVLEVDRDSYSKRRDLIITFRKIIDEERMHS